jgi:glyoxylase-like metal-dependent hydrolase (beta-lactamase superfamily II)
MSRAASTARFANNANDDGTRAMTLPSGIVRILAPNAGPFTGDGTNTYLVGHTTLTVVDPGPDSTPHCDAILATAMGRPIQSIVLTHAHRDHVDGLTRLVARTGARTYGFPRPAGQSHVPIASTDSPTGGDFVDPTFAPDVALSHGSAILTGDSHHPKLTAIHTPGHAPDHVCLALDGTHVLFSGDHVMGWSTSVIAPPEGNMGHYLTSLEGLLTRDETLYLPGHGAQIADGRRTARAYLLHRQMRERAVMEAIRTGSLTIPEIATQVYSGLSPTLWNAALLSVQAHVELLFEKRLLAFSAPLTLETRLSLCV